MNEKIDDQEILVGGSNKKKSCCKAVLRFLGSNVGLFIVLTAYIVAGSYGFMYFESGLEEEEKAIKFQQEQLLNDSEKFMTEYFATMHYDKINRLDNCTRLFRKTDQWTDYHQLSGRACPSTEYNTPFCQCVRMVRSMYEDEVGKNIEKMVGFLVVLKNDHGFDGTYGEYTYKWTLPNAMLFTMTTLTMIGYGVIAPRTDSGQLFCMAYTVFGLALMMLFLANIGNMMAKMIKTGYSRILCRWCRVRRRKDELPDDADYEPDKIKTDLVGEEDYMPTDKVAMPVTVTIIIMCLYIFGGAALFSYWEDWDFPSSVYFTWITLTTIGFGDYSPGSSFHGEMTFVQVLKMTFTTFYCLLGLALISMGISLSSEQVKVLAVKFAYVAGCKEDEEAKKRRLTLTRTTGVRETPKDRTGNKTDFFGFHKNSDANIKIFDLK